MDSSTKEFPLLQSITSLDNHSYLQNELTSIYFQLHRCHDPFKIRTLYSHILEVLHFLKTKSSDLSYRKYIKLLFCMIPQSRDVIYGKGEHDISYLLILAFYSFQPSLSIYALHRLVTPVTPNSHRFGSWRDIKHLCLFVKQYSIEKEEHPLISHAIHLVNNQLYNDINTYKFSPHCFSKQHISNVAKWIPREKNNKFAWLYDKLAFQWANQFKSYLFNNIDTPIQKQKAMNKAKKIYRKQFAFLNKQLHTTEVLLTQQKYDLIEPADIQMQTLVHQIRLFDPSDNQDKQRFTDKLNSHFETSFQPQEQFLYKHDFRNVNHISLGFLVKYAHQAIQNNNIKLQLFIDKLWNKTNILIPHYQKDFFIPVVDVSLTATENNYESLYSSLGLAIMLSQNSNVHNRIIAMDSLPTWITWDDHTTFTQKVSLFFHNISSCQSTLPVYDNVLDLISYGLTNSGASNYFTKNINIVFFSTFSNDPIPPSFLQSVDTFFQAYDKPPKVTFWNTSINGGLSSFPFSNVSDRAIYMSGFSTSVLRQFIKINKKTINKPKNAFEYIEQMCCLPYYDCFTTYLSQHL